MAQDVSPKELLTQEDAQAITAANEEMWNAHDVDRILSTYASDVVIRYADLPEMRGRAEAEAWLRARFARQRNYRLKKTLEAYTDNVVAGSWTGEWDDTKTGMTMAGRGAEFLHFSGGKVTLWVACFNAWPVNGERPASPLT